jgi:diguanylate cyclase (GGDEF)-like protein
MAQASVANPNELLSGNLALLHITNLLQSISMGHMTGRLHIEPQAGPLDIFFEAGLPVHAVSRQSSGEETFLEVVALNNGIFAFEPSLRTDVRSINSPIDSLILKGIQVLDCLGMLEAAGVTADSIVHRAKQGLSEAGFEECIKQGAPLDLALQKRFYITIDGQKSVKQLADTLNLARSEWIPVVANLIKLKLASFTKGGQVAKRVITVPPKRIDLVVVEQFAHNIKRPDTGAFTYPCFHYFLNQEYQRYKRTESPVAVILLDLKLQKTSSGTARGVVTPQCLAFVVQCIQPLKRELDLIMHYEGQTLAVLLPHTHAQEAINLARRISTAVVEGKFLVGMEKLNVSAVLGVASIPGDVTTAGELLAAAEMAKEKAHMSADGIQLFSDLS